MGVLKPTGQRILASYWQNVAIPKRVLDYVQGDCLGEGGNTRRKNMKVYMEAREGSIGGKSCIHQKGRN